jgi:glycosyltransferase involved in cell wall biosynthesis
MGLRIVALRGDNGGCGNYRISLPLTYLERAGHEVKVYQVDEQKAWTPGWFAGYDVMMVQRGQNVLLREMIDCIPPDKRPALVYEVDDLLWGMGPERVSFKDFRGAGIPKAIMDTMALCDGVIVSTPELCEEAQKVNPRACYILNSIDLTVRNWRDRYEPRLDGGRRTIIGWATGVRPAKDAQVIGRALRDVLWGRSDVGFAIAGDYEQSEEFIRALRLPEGQVCILPPAPFVEYPQLVSLFDIGIAPIQETQFNRCKSELKLLEYGAWGIPAVASDAAPYQRFAANAPSARQDGPGGVLLARAEKHWRKNLQRLVDDPGLRSEVGAMARAAVWKHYNMADRVEDYLQAFERAVEHSKRRTQ